MNGAEWKLAEPSDTNRDKLESPPNTSPFVNLPESEKKMSTVVYAANSAAQSVTGTQIPCYLFDSNRELAQHVAETIAGIIRQKNSLGQPAVLGLPTGSTPVGVYRVLIRMHQQEELDLSNVITFNLDEYYGIAPDQLQSYHRWMHEHFFNHVNIPAKNIHIPDGTVPLDRVDSYCREYERLIADAGGLDVLMLGIGRNGHIGFNEPFSVRNSRTRLALEMVQYGVEMKDADFSLQALRR